MLMGRHFAAGLERRQHLVHRFSIRYGLSFDAGANCDPGILVFHNLLLLIDFNPKMVGGNAHSFGKVKAVGIEPLHAGIELEIFATLRPRLFDQPIKQLTSTTARPVVFTGDQIIDVEKFSGKERFENPITGDAADFAVRFKIRELVAFLLLAQDALDELLRLLKERTQFPHHLMAAPNFLRRLRERDVDLAHVDLSRPSAAKADLRSRFPSYQM